MCKMGLAHHEYKMRSFWIIYKNDGRGPSYN